MTIIGLHHITIVTANAQRNVDFYAGTLGLRLVKKTVNFDDPNTYHLYYGDATGAPGTAITFFEWPGAARGRTGIGGTHHFALTVPDRDVLLKWKRYLNDRGIRTHGIFNRTYFESLYFTDPDGTIIELATAGPGLTVDEPAGALGQSPVMPAPANTRAQRDEDAIAAETWPEAVPALTPDMALTRGMHHISATSANINRTHRFYQDLLELPLVKQTFNYDDPDMKHWYWSAGEGSSALVTYFEGDPRRTRRSTMGAGQTHHFALAVADEDAQLVWREKLVKAGLPVSPVRDRTYFKSIYTKDPDGHIIEIATLPPGFMVDESYEALGSGLMLPGAVEPQRAELERALTPLTVPPYSLKPEVNE
jgi:glyoxalase family protein